MAKVNVKTGLQGRQNSTFKNYHTTTSDFFQLDVAYFREVAPKQSLELQLMTQARLAGMPVPSYADVSLNRRGFFVPMRTLFKGWNAFIEEQPYYTNNISGIQEHCPIFSLKSIIQFFIRPQIASEVPSTTTTFDFLVTYKIDSSTIFAKQYNFSDRGRQVYKVLTQLGYAFQLDNQTKTLSELDDVVFSALPLLSYSKIYADWYVPTAYRDFTSQYVGLQSTLAKIRESYNYILDDTDLNSLLFPTLFVPYGHDYFTDAFDRPTGNNVLNPDVSVKDPLVFSPTSNVFPDQVNVSIKGWNSGTTPSDGSPVLTPAVDALNSTNNASKITQFGLNALMKLTAWMKRKQIAGSRVLENYLAEYGVNLPAVNLDMSVYLKGDSVPIVIKDITATSQTLAADESTGANLGDYAGQGRVFPDNALHITCDANGEFGYFIVLTSLVPKIGYVQGLRRRCLHIKPLDFYHGDFDGLGNREIRLDELALHELSEIPLATYQYPWEEVFGFTPQYSEYKVSHDTLSGDFRIGRLNKAGFTSSAWHLNRMFDAGPNGLLNIPKHNLAFILPFVDKSQYSRIFYSLESPDMKTNADHFVLNHIQIVQSNAPFKALYEDYTLEHIDGNNSVQLDANGNYLN